MNHQVDIDNEILATFLGWEGETINGNYRSWYSNDGICRFIVARERLKFHSDWNELMKVIDKIRSLPDNVNEEIQIDGVVIDRFEIGQFGMYLSWYQWKPGWAYFSSYNMYIPGDEDSSNCESYIEAIYKTCLDFVKFINHEK